MTKEQTKAVKVSSGPPKTDTNSLTELRREIDHVRDMSDRSYSREKYFMVLVSVIFSAATGVSTYSVYDNSARARESVERSEKLVEELSGLQRPSYLASFGPAYPTESGELIAEYDLVQNWPSEDGSYIFQISLPVSGRISGPLGERSALNSKWMALSLIGWQL